MGDERGSGGFCWGMAGRILGCELGAGGRVEIVASVNGGEPRRNDRDLSGKTEAIVVFLQADSPENECGDTWILLRLKNAFIHQPMTSKHHVS